jgi:predicted RNA polymerase sigma factor
MCPSANALLALMCFQASREEARLGDSGQIILLKDQDRSRWNKKLIEKGLCHLDVATEKDSVSEYHLEAAIGACHAMANNFKATDWARIHTLYDVLYKIKPGPVVELNRAIALGYSVSAQAGLDSLLMIKGLEETYLYYAALGDFYNEINDPENSRAAYEKAIGLVTSRRERELLMKKRDTLL